MAHADDEKHHPGGYDGDKKPLHALLDEYESLPEGFDEELNALGEVPEEVVCAFVKKRLANFKKGNAGNGGAEARPPRESPP